MANHLVERNAARFGITLVVERGRYGAVGYYKLVDELIQIAEEAGRLKEDR